MQVKYYPEHFNEDSKGKKICHYNQVQLDFDKKKITFTYFLSKQLNHLFSNTDQSNKNSFNFSRYKMQNIASTYC